MEKLKQLPKAAYVKKEMDGLERQYHKLEFPGYAPLYCHGHKPCEQGGYLLEYHLDEGTEVHHADLKQWAKWTVMPAPIPKEEKDKEAEKVSEMLKK